MTIEEQDAGLVLREGAMELLEGYVYDWLDLNKKCAAAGIENVNKGLNITADVIVNALINQGLAKK